MVVPMTDVLDLQAVTIRRGTTTILDEVTWTVREGERWVVLGRNGAGKTTLLQVASGRMHPTSGTADLLGSRMGRVDVFELRPRIGITSAALAERIPRPERVHDVVVSASYGVVGRWREAYDDLDHRRATDLLTEVGVAHLVDRTFGTLSEGERKAILAAGNDGFFTIPHFDGYAGFLIQLRVVARPVLKEAIVDSWLAVAPAALADPYVVRRSRRRT